MTVITFPDSSGQTIPVDRQHGLPVQGSVGLDPTANGISAGGFPANFVESSGSLTAAAFQINANPARKGIIISNTSDTVMTARVSPMNAPVPLVATAAIGIPVPAGDSINLTSLSANLPNGAISVFCAGTSKTYTIYEW